MTTLAIGPEQDEVALPEYAPAQLRGPFQTTGHGGIELPKDLRERREFLLGPIAEHVAWLQSERDRIRELRRPYAGMRPVPPVGSTAWRIVRRLSNLSEQLHSMIRQAGSVPTLLEKAAPPAAIARRDALKAALPQLERISTDGLAASMAKDLTKIRNAATQELAKLNSGLQSSTWTELEALVKSGG